MSCELPKLISLLEAGAGPPGGAAERSTVAWIVMAAFEFQYFENQGLMQIVLAEDFSEASWPELQQFYASHQDDANIHYWDFDMRQVPYINSMLLGLLVGFNAVIVNRGGEFRLLVAKGSKTADLINFSKLNRIINVRQS